MARGLLRTGKGSVFFMFFHTQKKFGTCKGSVFFMFFHTKLQVGFRALKKILSDIKKEIGAARAGGENRLSF